MNKLLLKAKGVNKDGCVTITLNTHRTRPDNEQDPINLKNLMKEAEERLYNEYDKRFVWPIIENMTKLVETIDHSHNLESLILFINEDFADYIRLPVSVQNRVVVDKTFATRDLIRAMYQEQSYYVLLLSRQEVKLFKAYNDKIVEEIGGEFPLENNLPVPNKEEQTTSKEDNLIQEFFNQADKAMQDATKDDPLPVVVASERRNFDYYYNVADKKERIMGHLNLAQDPDRPFTIVEEAWSQVLDLIKQRQRERLEELDIAISQHKIVSDYSEIWNAIHEGRGQTLFVKKGFYQPAYVQDNHVILASPDEKDESGVMDDIIDQMIEKNLEYGGDTVFIEGDELKKFRNIVLITRY